MRSQRGFTFVSFLLLLAVAGAIFWGVTFGPAYLDNFEVKSVLKQAANFCYQEKDDEKVREYILRKLHDQFDEEREERGRMVRALKLEFEPADLQVERTRSPAYVNIWLTYSRTVKMPFVGQERRVTFTDHAEQDLSPTKW